MLRVQSLLNSLTSTPESSVTNSRTQTCHTHTPNTTTLTWAGNPATVEKASTEACSSRGEDAPGVGGDHLRPADLRSTLRSTSSEEDIPVPPHIDHDTVADEVRLRVNCASWSQGQPIPEPAFARAVDSFPRASSGSRPMSESSTIVDNATLELDSSAINNGSDGTCGREGGMSSTAGAQRGALSFYPSQIPDGGRRIYQLDEEISVLTPRMRGRPEPLESEDESIVSVGSSKSLNVVGSTLHRIANSMISWTKRPQWSMKKGGTSQTSSDVTTQAGLTANTSHPAVVGQGQRQDSSRCVGNQSTNADTEYDSSEL